MTLVTIDLGDVAGGHDPDDHVIIRAEAFRESPGGGVTSTAEVKIPLVDGVGQAEVEPGPVVVAFRCRAVADTREKRGVVPDTGPVGIEDVIGGAFEYTPAIVNRSLDQIEGARDEAIAQVSEAVDELTPHLDDFATVVTGKNLIDPAQITHDRYIHSNGLDWRDPVPGFQITGYIPVQAGVTYTINAARAVAFYDLEGQYISGTYASLPNAPYTFTPDEDRLFRAHSDTARLGTWQMEIGPTPTDYEPFARRLSDVIVPRSALAPRPGEQRFHRDGPQLTALTTLGGAPLEIKASLTGNAGKVFDWGWTSYDGRLITTSSDDVAPVVTQQHTIGGNHGFANAVYWPAGTHDKTTADLGSRWVAESGVEYAIIQIRDDGALIAARKYDVDEDGVISFRRSLPTAPLTHVSGATNTTTLAAPTGLTQMRPAFQRLRQRVTVDGVEFTGGEITGAELRIQESYDILDFASIYDLMTSNIGTPYEDMTVAGAMRLESDWRVHPHGKISGEFHLTELMPTQLGRWSGIHASSSSSLPTRWLPGVKPLDGLPVAEGVPRLSIPPLTYVTVEDLVTPGQPPTVCIDVGTDLALAIGVDPWYEDGRGASRIADVPNALWFFTTGGKFYPRVAGNRPPGWGRVSIRGIRHFLTLDEAADALAFPDDATLAWSSLATTY